MEGLAKGTLVITFEDSNGDEVKISKEFEATVQSEMIRDFSQEAMGGEMGSITNTAKKPILPIWLFIIVQFGILILGVPITRKVKLSLYRELKNRKRLIKPGGR